MIKMDKKKLGATLLIIALVLSVLALTLYFNTEEKMPVEQKAVTGGNSASVQLVVEPATGGANEQG